MTREERSLLSRLRLETWRGVRRFAYTCQYPGFSAWPPPPGWVHGHPLPDHTTAELGIQIVA